VYTKYACVCKNLYKWLGCFALDATHEDLVHDMCKRYTYVCVYIYTYTCMYICIYICMYTWGLGCLALGMTQIDFLYDIQKFNDMCIRYTRACAYIYTYIYIDVYVYMYIYTCIYTGVGMFCTGCHAGGVHVRHM